MFRLVRRVPNWRYRRMVRQWRRAGCPVVTTLPDGTEIVRFTCRGDR